MHMDTANKVTASLHILCRGRIFQLDNDSDVAAIITNEFLKKQ